MKNKTTARSLVLPAWTSAVLALSACAPVTSPEPPRAVSHPDTPATFADVLNIQVSVPCRVEKPAFTDEQRQAGLHGSVRITYVVGTAGRVDMAIVDSSSGNADIDTAARDAVARSTCAPYVVNGVAHRVLQHMVFNFGMTPPGMPTMPGGMPLPAAPRARGPAIASDFDRADPGTPAAGTTPLWIAPPAGGMGKAPLTLEEAVQDATLARMGIAPNSPRAAQFKRWTERMRNDPDVSRLLGNGPNHTNVMQLSPSLRVEFFLEGILRLSPEQRSRLAKLTSQAFDNAPPDCGGVKNAGLVMQRYLPLATISDADANAYFDLTFDVLKQSALQAPLAHVTETQRLEAQQNVMKTLQAMLKNDPQGLRDVATAIANPAAVTPEIWCKNVRIHNRALLATPQPYRDWSMIAADSDANARLAPLASREMQGGGMLNGPTNGPANVLPNGPAASASNGSAAAAPSPGYPATVRRAVRPNIVWDGPTLDAETAIAVHCTPSGTLLSASIARSSGNPAWDMAALRAVQRTDPMPVDAGGRAPRDFTITLRAAN